MYKNFQKFCKKVAFSHFASVYTHLRESANANNFLSAPGAKATDAPARERKHQ